MDISRRTELSDREKQLVRLAAHGHTDSSIAHELGISEATVGTYWGRVRIKIGPYSRTELIARIIREELQSIIDTLKDENKHLIEELQKATGIEWGRPEGNYYRDLVLEAPDAVLIVNSAGLLEIVNEEAAKMFGYERHELEGQVLHVLVPQRLKLLHVGHREDYMRHPSKRRMAEHSAAVGCRKDGTQFSIAASLSPIETASGVQVICIVRELAPHSLADVADPG